MKQRLTTNLQKRPHHQPARITRSVLLLMILAGIFPISATTTNAVENYDDYGIDDAYSTTCALYPYWNVCQTNLSSYGTTEDKHTWTGGEIIINYNSFDSYLQMVCIDVDCDGDQDSCVNRADTAAHYDPQDCIDNFAEIAALDSTDPDYIYVMDTSTHDWYWGDDGVPLIIGPSVDNNIQQMDTTINQERDFCFDKYYDCENFRGQRDFVSSTSQTYSTSGSKGQYCNTGTTGRSVAWIGTTDQQTFDTFDCSYNYLGVNIGFCNSSYATNTSVASYTFPTQTWGTFTATDNLTYTKYVPYLCDRNATAEEEAETAYSIYNCNNGILDTEINETETDYGGPICGSCNENATKTTDTQYTLARQVKNEYYDYFNRFNQNDCEEATEEATLVLGVVITILAAFIVLIVFATIILVYINAAAAIQTGIKIYQLLKRFAKRTKHL